MSPKQLLLRQTTAAFSGRDDMSLMASLKEITDEEASWRPDEASPTSEQIVRHIAWAKSRFCQEGFGRPMVLIDPHLNESGDHPGLPWEFPCGAAWGSGEASGMTEAIRLLERSHAGLVACLESSTDESLEEPIPTHHGTSAAHFFSVMLMHDLYHAGQIRTRRSACRGEAARGGSGAG
jgi:hypothetical protein